MLRYVALYNHGKIIRYSQNVPHVFRSHQYSARKGQMEGILLILLMTPLKTRQDYHNK